MRSTFLSPLLAIAALAFPVDARTAEAHRPQPAADSGAVQPGEGAAGAVRARPRPDYDAVGLPLGSFRAWPKLALSTAYDSNILRSENNATSDLIARIAPAMRLESDWPRHRLTLSTVAEIGLYARHESENFADAEAAAAGTIDIQRDLRLEISAGLAHGHEERGSIDGDGGTEPVTHLRWAGAMALAGDRGRFGYQIGADFARTDYRDVPAVGGGVLNQDDRDHQVLTGSAQLGYRAWRDGNLFLTGRVARTDYDAARDDSGFNRDSRTQTLVGGLEMDWNGITFGQIYGGWFSEQYDDAALRNLSGFLAGAEVAANVTPLTTVTLRASREALPTVTAGASALVQTKASLGLDHELLRNLVVGANVQGRRLQFKGLDRSDDLWAAGIGADWLLNRSMSLRLHYDFDMRDSQGTAAAEGWYRHVVGLRIVLER